MPKKKSTKTRRKQCRVRVPASFDPEIHLPPELRKHADSARYLLHRIIWGHVRKKHDSEDYVPLKFAYLRQVIPERIIVPLRKAMEPDLIECDHHYIEKYKSFGYRLGTLFRDDRIVQVVIDDPATAKKITKNRRADDRKIRLDVHCWLRSKFKLLEIDLPEAKEILSGHHDFEAVKVPIEEIAERETHFCVCPYGRVHTPLTRLSKRVRCCLHAEGQRLVNLDIANSQPLFLALLMMNFRKHGNQSFGFRTFKENAIDPYKNIDSIIQQTVIPFQFNKRKTNPTAPSAANTNRIAMQEVTEVTQLQALTETACCPQTYPRLEKLNRSYLNQDELLFVDLCERGKLYEHLAQVIDANFRESVKKDFFAVLFSQNNFQSPLKSAFSREFPNVAEVIRVHKRRNYKFLAQLLQNIESNFIINNVVRRIMEQHPEAPIFTIHDSVMTTPEYVDFVHCIMQAEFASLGLAPSFKTEDYGEQPKWMPEGLREPLAENAGWVGRSHSPTNARY